MAATLGATATIARALAAGMDRRGTSSAKWEKYAGLDVLPFWVADMDLPTAPFVIDAVQARLEHPVLGYTTTPDETVDAFVGWVARIAAGMCIQTGWSGCPAWFPASTSRPEPSAAPGSSCRHRSIRRSCAWP